LLELIEKNLDVLEEKKTDAKSSFQKQKVWQDINESFMKATFKRVLKAQKGTEFIRSFMIYMSYS
jgi:hypothetical protein